eukprot:CAMPEP_0176126754 /NCGR_PEP_ID=MMETSP0120_2-20121206/63985_1 /TAXON_ID=160619 /ORGANISM="Kryptoperidinium foliaceum, Strain CCMP 1326" /LENGTH=174 /DNA_ID=CAMNT_0017461703 /DNA_START=42 /DNA_END=563 /DNA_ORIENTATION=-
MLAAEHRPAWMKGQARSEKQDSLVKHAAMLVAELMESEELSCYLSEDSTTTTRSAHSSRGSHSGSADGSRRRHVRRPNSLVGTSSTGAGASTSDLNGRDRGLSATQGGQRLQRMGTAPTARLPLVAHGRPIAATESLEAAAPPAPVEPLKPSVESRPLTDAASDFREDVGREGA